jgi:hypothetical protein
VKQVVLFPLLLQLQVLHVDYPVHIEGHLDFVGDLDDGAVGNVVLDDLDYAALAQEGRSVLYYHYLWLEAQDPQ